MKRKLVICDICGADITDSTDKFKFKSYNTLLDGWHKCDMCVDCYLTLRRFFVMKEKEDARRSNYVVLECI